MLFSTAYFPPVEYFAKIAEGFTLSTDEVKPSVIWIEACEHYKKQTYRNRFRYYAADGVQSLSFPVVHGESAQKLQITDVEVDWSTPWLIRTERAISAAYESSAYFDHYSDELFGLLEERPRTLFELNLGILRFFLGKTGIRADIRFTEEFTPDGSGIYGEDLREAIHPKRPNTILKDLALEKPYFQVFARKYGFVPNLSIMDLLFNEGPDAILYLKNL
ncbi:MAG: WbqC family protein [Bacteroidales bacterium]|nr:WbqC family protein [Bacteroidales bacterium]MBR5055453.1 WbqC family protein [Bacteroidales bacterium]